MEWLQHLPLALGGSLVHCALPPGPERALKLDPRKIGCPKVLHRHGAAPGRLHVRRDPGVHQRQQMQNWVVNSDTLQGLWHRMRA